MTTTILIIAFLGTFGLILSAGLLLFYRDVVLERLSAIVDQRLGSSPGWVGRFLHPKQGTVEQFTRPFQNVLPRSAQEVSVVQKRLIRAGYRKDSYVNVFYGAKVLVPLSLVVLVTVTGISALLGPFFAYALAAGLGFLLPDFWLGNRIGSRQLRIRLGLPEALDLLVICSEAGLSLDHAILRCTEELKLSQPDIADEFGLMMLEQKAGRPRDEALKGLADRTDIDSIRSLVNTLVQADTFGTSIAKTLRVYSETMRTQRRQQAEEQAAKTTVKLVFPLVFFIFPSLFVVALGPAMISMFEGFAKYFS
jgi:tight adherence protein C